MKAIQTRIVSTSAIKDAITASLKDDPMIMIESGQPENIEFSANYLHSIEQRMLAEVEVQKLQQNAEREKVQAQITVTQATAKANAVRAEAQASADALRLNGEACDQHQADRRGRSRRHRGPANGARHSMPTSSRWSGRTLTDRTADHHGAGPPVPSVGNGKAIPGSCRRESGRRPHTGRLQGNRPNLLGQPDHRRVYQI